MIVKQEEVKVSWYIHDNEGEMFLIVEVGHRVVPKRKVKLILFVSAGKNTMVI